MGMFAQVSDLRQSQAYHSCLQYYPAKSVSPALGRARLIRVVISVTCALTKMRTSRFRASALGPCTIYKLSRSRSSTSFSFFLSALRDLRSSSDASKLSSELSPVPCSLDLPLNAAMSLSESNSSDADTTLVLDFASDVTIRGILMCSDSALLDAARFRLVLFSAIQT
ncbi:hypothetical protein EV424DRAFT_1372887 [Suillus variegatus]|nr:hypothetical protein EV424DRAFT_1387862 [Suillus variegatus]KAG1831324.1 hypothetical protein EV424DRAFT_1372887 [Suillus variegatus]